MLAVTEAPRHVRPFCVLVVHKHRSHTNVFIRPMLFSRFYLHPMGTTEEAPCHNTFVQPGVKFEAHCLQSKGQPSRSYTDKHATNTLCHKYNPIISREMSIGM